MRLFFIKTLFTLQILITYIAGIAKLAELTFVLASSSLLGHLKGLLKLTEEACKFCNAFYIIKWHQGSGSKFFQGGW